MGPHKSEEVPDLSTGDWSKPNFKFVPQSGECESGYNG